MLEPGDVVIVTRLRLARSTRDLLRAHTLVIRDTARATRVRKDRRHAQHPSICELQKLGRPLACRSALSCRLRSEWPGA